jgi:protoporphyrinogen oxidase
MNWQKEVVVLGAGLAGLSAGRALAQAGRRVAFVDAGSEVGGMSRTVVGDGYRFDLGGHRFFTNDKKIEEYVKGLMGAELLTVPRTSTILLRGKYFDYPLKPLNAIFGLGGTTTAKVLLDYVLQRLKNGTGKGRDVSLEDRVVRDFGRALFNLYFKQYSEKVWGVGCDRISADWVAQRIRGLSLGVALKNAFFKVCGKDLPTLADHFLYPSLGVGRIAERLLESTGELGTLHSDTRVTRVHHKGGRIERVEAGSPQGEVVMEGKEFVSSIPLSSLVGMLAPEAPLEIQDAASRLRYRDLVVAAISVDREKVTDQSWIYLPEKSIPFGRLHEPKNWSPLMADEGKTVLVAEYFCFRGDEVWEARDEEIVETTIAHLEQLGFIDRHAARGGQIVRVPRAYPLFEVGYADQVAILFEYLKGFVNLHVIGRNGMFRYYNMDHAIESGLDAAEDVLARDPRAGRTTRAVLV